MKAKKQIKKEIKKFENKITKLLDEAKTKYKLIEHRVVYTAHDAAQTTKKKLSEIAKVVLVKADKDFVLIVLPAGKYVDLGGIKKALKAKKVSMASEKDITKYLKTKVGLLHPFGSLFKLPHHPSLSPKVARGLGVLLDKGMMKTKKMIASAGSYTHSVEISLKDFEKLAQPVKGVFASSKRK
jgi:prolyl-tRNA editing enzyme YbaK/EbsC (Cys-tRNA(Pro) deacylase)